MKSINKSIIPLLLFFAVIAGGCTESFLDRPSQSQISSNNFYQTTSDLRLATASLYGGAPWMQWHNSALLPLGDILSGNAYFAWFGDFVQLYTRTITAQNSVVASGWTGLYNVVAQCNTVINAIQEQAASSISATDKNAAIAEARFIRAVAYYHLAVMWGAVPIIEDNRKLIQNPLLNRNIISDVYKFIIADLTYAAQNLPTTDASGRVTTWSAQGMLAKVYLTAAGLGQTGGTRNQEYLDNAKKYAGNVCKNSGLSLLPNYYNLFRAQYNDNQESLFSLQWTAGVGYSNGNHWLTYSPSNDINPQKNGAWTPLAPTYDLYLLYSPKDTVRRKASFMLNGDYYPELNAAGGGYKSTGQAMKKHIIGNEKDNNAPTMDIWSSVEHNAILRLADVYLIYAEAVLGNNASTTDADALSYFNKVRTRAGVDPVATLDLDAIYRERRIELAFEGQYWIDLVRLSYYNPTKALSVLSNQQRVTFKYDKGVATTTPAGEAGGPQPIVAPTIGSFTLPIPASELTSDPKLADAPVPYY
ncbi:RagB/SusD family nutrient uptake outer membrane protein [Paludibacter sp.]|uniref:RagB/SusD family nutrient uptake outer membrane protein n=1 Tax=Paludibacter sp. TaxID=1898105 RepID=UPI0013526C0E|nr:RagB/SusD family nutrient uptake outer membrane protein [Paludibacter sp.]MTK54449.1 RagB/SusD family nutrient uptake outer membrane protein [Paludibacter sp.]